MLIRVKEAKLQVQKQKFSLWNRVRLAWKIFRGQEFYFTGGVLIEVPDPTGEPVTLSLPTNRFERMEHR